MIKGAIFDLDGTLLDSLDIWETVAQDYLRELGYEPREDINEMFKAFSLYQAACYYRETYGIRLSVEELMAGINRRVEDFYFHTVPAKPGIQEFLEKISGKNVRMCVATATDRYQAEAALKRCGIAGYFSEIFTCTEVGSGKDEPLIYRAALAHLGTAKEETAVFEDALHAIKTAKQDGFPTVGIYDRHHREQDEIQRLADAYVKDFSDVRVLEELERLGC